VIALTVQTFGFTAAEVGGLWLLGALALTSAGCGVLGILSRHRSTRIIAAVAIAFLFVLPNVPIKWDCGDLPWWLCWL
jgi:hypothetical protein